MADITIGFPIMGLKYETVQEICEITGGELDVELNMIRILRVITDDVRVPDWMQDI